MSFTSAKREQIKTYILEKLEAGEPSVPQRTADTFQVSLNTIYRYIKELVASKVIQYSEASRSYSLIKSFYSVTLRKKSGELEEEDRIYQKIIEKYVKDFSENVRHIWEYSFMEMMNNAIDHSNASQVTISVSQSYLNTTILIQDNGIGIFRKIKEYYQYDSLDDAIRELFKGKLTTDSANHSGEGIFFTSRVLDCFMAISDGKIFSHDKYTELLRNLEDVEILNNWKDRPGTTIYMELSNHSNTILSEVFDMFSDKEGAFIKTRIPLKNIFEVSPISRSQAKRLCSRFENFQEIILDFAGIEDIGQGFAHEIFVVYQNKHPELSIIPVNDNERVHKMISHVILS